MEKEENERIEGSASEDKANHIICTIFFPKE